MGKPIRVPTSPRWLTTDEWNIVAGVFGATLPMRQRVFITNGAGVDGRAFTIPTSLTSSLPPMAVGAFMALGFGAAVMSLVADVWSSTILAYIMNVGPDFYGDLTAMDLDNQDDDASATPVHEMTHVWQGKNSTFALTYVFSSVINQAFSGTGAYSYSIGDPWRSMNAKQQTQLVEYWY